jgi:hypothetical protein
MQMTADVRFRRQFNRSPQQPCFWAAGLEPPQQTNLETLGYLNDYSSPKADVQYRVGRRPLPTPSRRSLFYISRDSLPIDRIEEDLMDHQAFAQLLGSYGEFVGAIGVVATLGYLAIQIRISNRTNTALALQNLTNRAQERMMAMADPEFAKTVSEPDYEKLERWQKQQVQTWVMVHINDLQDQFRQQRLGILPATSLKGRLNTVLLIRERWRITDEAFDRRALSFDLDFVDWYRAAIADADSVLAGKVDVN